MPPTTPLRSHETEEVRPERREAERLLEAGDLEGARQRLEAWLEREPDDARARGLLGLCCFRLGRLDEAARLYQALVDRNPSDATLRVNLGLVALKRGDAAEAAAQFEVAVSLAPNHRKALNYLGLALAQRGEYALARDAFERAGATAMAERMAAQLAEEEAAAAQRAAEEAAAAQRAAAEATGAQHAAAATPAEGTEPAPADPPAATAIEAAPVRPAAPPPPPEEEADAFAAAFAEAPPQQPAAPARNDAPRVAVPPAPPRDAVEPPARATAFAEVPPLEWPEGRPFAVGPEGAAIEFATEIRTRLDGLVAAHGVAAWTPVQKRFRGNEIDRLFGTGTQQMWRATGGGRLLFHARGRTFTSLRLEGETYFVEDRVFAFDEGLRWENGRLPGQATDLHLVRFSGAGQVLLVTARAIRAERVDGGCLSLPTSGLAGWTGALAPRLVGAEEGPAVPWIELSGTGTVLLVG